MSLCYVGQSEPAILRGWSAAGGSGDGGPAAAAQPPAAAASHERRHRPVRNCVFVSPEYEGSGENLKTPQKRCFSHIL